MESRNNYGWGMVGSTKEGYEWLLVYGSYRHQRLKSGYVYKTESEAIREGEKFARNHSCEEYRNGTVTAVKATPLHYEY